MADYSITFFLRRKCLMTLGQWCDLPCFTRWSGRVLAVLGIPNFWKRRHWWAHGSEILSKIMFFCHKLDWYTHFCCAMYVFDRKLPYVSADRHVYDSLQIKSALLASTSSKEKPYPVSINPSLLGGKTGLTKQSKSNAKKIMLYACLVLVCVQCFGGRSNANLTNFPFLAGPKNFLSSFVGDNGRRQICFRVISPSIMETTSFIYTRDVMEI